MPDENRINPGHYQIRSVLRVAGPVTVGAGVLLTVIGLGSFFAAFGSMETPRFFWCAFLGGPLIVVGFAMSMAGFMGAISRYQAGEIAPVGKDTFNYLADASQPGMRTMASAFGSGLSDGMGAAGLKCSQCGHVNDHDARFCDECGSAMAKICPKCREQNDGDARFCDSCGAPLD